MVWPLESMMPAGDMHAQAVQRLKQGGKLVATAGIVAYNLQRETLRRMNQKPRPDNSHDRLTEPTHAAVETLRTPARESCALDRLRASNQRLSQQARGQQLRAPKLGMG